MSCPKRAVHPERLPGIDVLIVSHRHPDHFDLRSLARVPRDCDVINPADPRLGYALDRLGFRHIHPVQPMAPILSETFELYPTKSDVRTVREFGMVFRDGSGVFWNQVDSFLSGETVDTVKARFGRVDLLFAMYASQNLDFFETGSREFPYETHRDNLETVLQIDPRVAVPGAAGFRFCAEHAWLNPFLFPISRERFAEDLGRLGFGGRLQVMNPGDRIEIDAGEVVHRAAASDVAETLEDDTARTRFDPTAPVSGLRDPNPDGYPRSRLTRSIKAFLKGLVAYARAGDRDPVVEIYRRHRARYGVGVVTPEGHEDWRRLDFKADGVTLETGSPASQSMDITHRIAASALVDWIEHRKSFFYVRAYLRRRLRSYEEVVRQHGNPTRSGERR